MARMIIMLLALVAADGASGWQLLLRVTEGEKSTRIAPISQFAGAQEESEPQPCLWEHPPAWPSFCFQAMDDEALRQVSLVRFGQRVVAIPEGAMVLGWLGTYMPDRPIRVWVYTRPDKAASSRLLHGDALERLYAEVTAWLRANGKMQ